MTDLDPGISDNNDEGVGPMRILVAVFIGLMLLVGSTDEYCVIFLMLLLAGAYQLLDCY